MTEYFQSRAPRTVPVWTFTSTDYSAATRRYTVGASLELRLQHGFGLELDAIYKRMGYVRSDLTFGLSHSPDLHFDVKGNSWEFPMVAKYRFGWPLHPYVAGGFVLRHIGPVRARGVMTERKLIQTDQNVLTRIEVTTPIDTSDPPDLRKRNFPGVTFGGGIEFGRGRLRLLPELRYTRWTANISDFGPLRLEPNQVEFLLGFLF